MTVVDQLANYLRELIISGELGETMPGIRKLAGILGVSSNTVSAAIEQLSMDLLLVPQGHGKRSKIATIEEMNKPTFRLTMLPYERADVEIDYVVEIQRRLREAGHSVTIADKSLVDLAMKVERIARLVDQTETDAWLVFSAPKHVLQWFVDRSLPAFALFGRFRQLPMPGTGLDKIPAFRAAIRRLVELGHRRIVLLQPDHNRKPTHARLVIESLEEMEKHGIKTGSYNIPDWEQSPAGLRKCLDTLFALSAPTAILFDRPNELLGAQIYLAHRGILAPRDVSLVCDDDPAFEWCNPSISCIQWQSHSWVRQVVHWADCMANGKEYQLQRLTKATFVERDSIGPVPV